jgi:hypothetical protein
MQGTHDVALKQVRVGPGREKSLEHRQSRLVGGFDQGGRVVLGASIDIRPCGEERGDKPRPRTHSEYKRQFSLISPIQIEGSCGEHLLEFG